jgi:AcrR family transcriptional regulator
MLLRINIVPSVLRKQRNQERKDRTRGQLLRAATRVFAHNGYHKTLISDIVAEAGVGQGTFYRSFRDKREIFETLLEGFVSELLGEFSDMSANLPTSVQEYRNASLGAILRAARVVERNRDLCLVFLREAPTLADDISESISGMHDRLAQLAKFYLDHAIAHGFARPCNSEVVSQAIIGMGTRMVEAWLHGGFPGLAVEALVTEVVDLAFQGIAPKGAVTEEAARVKSVEGVPVGKR